MRFSRAASVVLFAFVLSASAASADRPFDRSSLARISAAWDQHAREFHVPSYTVEVVTHSHVIYRHSYGGRDCAARKIPNSSTIYYIASATKPFTATAIMKLAQEKKVDLDAPVKKYLPRFELADARASETITVRDLLSHRQGLDSNKLEIGEAFIGGMEDDKFYRLLKQVQPRGKFRYSNLHYTLLGRVIEAVTGHRWSDYLQKAILSSAKMKRTVTSAAAIHQDTNSACDLEENGNSWRAATIQKTDRTMHAAGGLGSTADDLGRWMQLQLNEGRSGTTRLLSSASMKQMFSPAAEVGTQFFTFDRDSYGLGWYLGRYRGEKLIHHFGSFPGARSHLSFLPEHDVAVVVLMNEEDPVFYFVDAVASDIYDIALHLEPGEHWNKATEAVARSRRKIAERWQGFRPLLVSDLPQLSAETFYNSDWGTLTLAHEGEFVQSHIGDLPVPLYFNPQTKELGAEIIDAKFTAKTNQNSVIFQKGESLQLEFHRAN
ncbi:MAG TPA: serine hydrolase domain-containing protein [Terriglobales bacterium]|nr:serine hydrolase domain-containing protein [Terriglobales bacterium]